MPQKVWVVSFDNGYAPGWVDAVFLDEQEARDYAGDTEATGLFVEEFAVGRRKAVLKKREAEEIHPEIRDAEGRRVAVKQGPVMRLEP